MKRRILPSVMSILLSASMAISIVPMPKAYADEIIVKPDTSVTTGTQDNARENSEDADEDIANDVAATIESEWEEIYIFAPEDLVLLAKRCRLDTWSRNKYIVLKNDISLDGVDFECIPTFGGVFDGNGYTISGYKMSEGQSNIGFFATIQISGIVRNLRIEGDIEPANKQAYVGGVVGRNNGVIINCHFKGDVVSNDYVGGIAGVNELNGIIADSMAEGFVSGEHFTGGIAGENLGNIIRCTNEASVNTTEREVSLSIEDLNIDAYADLFNIDTKDSDKDAASGVNGIVDAGGIAGVSIGVIENSKNKGNVGYDMVGYNVGGIAGRQSGYIGNCINEGDVKGRKDVAGIVGQAEPYIATNLTEDVIEKLHDGINELSGLLDNTLDDTDITSDTISNRLSIINGFTNEALNNTDYLSDKSIDYANGLTGSVNEALDRVEYIIDESKKSGGAVDNTNAAVNELKDASEHLIKTVEALDVYSYMTPEERSEYDDAQKKLKDLSENYAKALDEATRACTHYYRDKIRHSSTDYKDADGNVVDFWSGTPNEQDMYARDEAGNTLQTSADELYIQVSRPAEPASAIVNAYTNVKSWFHNASGEDYPAASGDQKILDEKVEYALEHQEVEHIKEKSKAYADIQYPQYDSDLLDLSTTMARIISNHTSEMSADASSEANKAIDDVKKASDSATTANNQTKDTLKEVRDRGDITLPTLDEEYRNQVKSLNNNLQNMSDNFELLNGEMNSSTDVLTDDLGHVNDQFVKIMDLYTDAMNTLLDGDMSDNVEDMSLEVAEICTDATVANCLNKGTIDGAIDVAGIAGTMAVEYDFDLESDITGKHESAINTAYLTKCVLRDNKNKGVVTAEKSYAAGGCGLQEMGTILRCGNYATITSNSGEYVGGVAGSSLSNIVNSYAKCILSGSDYVGGIAGSANNVYDSYSLVQILDEESYYGAIAGDVTGNGKIRGCYFVSDDLAGIDRVSYALKAEPVSYEELINIEGLPEEFKTMKVTFLLDNDDDERIEVATQDVKYGYTLSPDEFPFVTCDDGNYISWSIKDAVEVFSDLEIHAESLRDVTTLASSLVRSTKQSAILVDGSFMEDDRLTANVRVNAPDELKNCIEYWELEIPDDGAVNHQIRYSLPDDYRDEIGSAFGVYIYENGQWNRVKEVGMMGAYYTFDVSGNNVGIQIVNEYKKDNRTMIFIIVGVGVVGLLVLVLILKKVSVPKNKKTTNKKTE